MFAFVLWCAWHQSNVWLRWVCTHSSLYVCKNTKPQKSQNYDFYLSLHHQRWTFRVEVHVMEVKRTNECERAKCTSLSGLSFCLIKRKTMSFVVNGMRIEPEFNNYYCCRCFSASSVVFVVAHKYHCTFTFSFTISIFVKICHYSIVSRVSISIEYNIFLYPMNEVYTLHIHFHILRALKPTTSTLQNNQKHRQKLNRKKDNDHDDDNKNEKKKTVTMTKKTLEANKENMVLHLLDTVTK